MVDEKVERIDMLFNKTLNLQKCGQKVPLVLIIGQ